MSVVRLKMDWQHLRSRMLLAVATREAIGRKCEHSQKINGIGRRHAAVRFEKFFAKRQNMVLIDSQCTFLAFFAHIMHLRIDIGSTFEQFLQLSRPSATDSAGRLNKPLVKLVLSPLTICTHTKPYPRS